MKSVLHSVLVLSLTLAACTNPYMSEAERSALRQGIYDGEITPSENPISHTTVLIYGDKGDTAFTCTGSVLTSTIILTAAHCVINIDETKKTVSVLKPEQLQIFDPTKLPAASPGYVLSIGAKVIAHPKYLAQKAAATKSHYTVGYDVALIQLETPLPKTYKPVILSDNLDELTKNQMYIAGFGDYSLDSSKEIDFKLRNGKVNIDLNNKFVEKDLEGDGIPKDLKIPYMITNMPEAANISFVKNSSGSSVCHGDSGGPLYFEKDGEIYLAGINAAIYTTQGEPQNCATEGTGYVLSVSLAGPQLRFILDSYKEMTGTSLPLQRDVAEKDPNTFEFYLNSSTLITKNSTFDIANLSVVRDGRDNTIVILDNAQMTDICSHPENLKLLSGLNIPMSSQAPESVLDGKTIIPFLASVDGAYKTLFEGRMKREGDKVKTVVLTAEGYLSAEMPMVTCSFQK